MAEILYFLKKFEVEILTNFYVSKSTESTKMVFRKCLGVCLYHTHRCMLTIFDKTADSIIKS